MPNLSAWGSKWTPHPRHLRRHVIAGLGRASDRRRGSTRPLTDVCTEGLHARSARPEIDTETDGEVDAGRVGVMPDAFRRAGLRRLLVGACHVVGTRGIEEPPGRRSRDVDDLVLEALRSKLSKGLCRRGGTTATRMSASACLELRRVGFGSVRLRRSSQDWRRFGCRWSRVRCWSLGAREAIQSG